MFGVPLEYLMFGAIGFCLAWLTALMVLPAVHNRAARLARERYDTLPLSVQEMRAEKDTIRAGFAAATRELELRIGTLREKTVAHASDLAKKNQLIDRLKREVETAAAALRESETQAQAARDELRETRRGFADKDVTLGTAEGQLAALQRDLAGKDAALQAAMRDLTAIRGDAPARDSALRAAEREVTELRSKVSDANADIAALGAQIASLKTELKDSTEREQAAREQLRDIRRGRADRDADLTAVENEVEALHSKVAAREAALAESQRDIAALRGELAAKDAALNHAEKEITAIRAEITALSTLLVNTGSTASARPEPAPASAKIVEMAPFIAPSRMTAPLRESSAAGTEQPARQQPLETQPVRSVNDRTAPRAPIDVIPAPSRLLPPGMPQARHSEESVRQAAAEIADAAQRVEERQTGQNQQLRAAYAPLVKTST